MIIVFVSSDSMEREDSAKQGVLLPLLGVRQREELALPCSQGWHSQRLCNAGGAHLCPLCMEEVPPQKTQPGNILHIN